MRSQFLSAACAAAVTLAAAPPALAAPSVTVQAPASTTPETRIDVVYSGIADAPGTADPNGPGGQDMMLRAFYELNAASCAPTAAAQRARAKSTVDGQPFIQTPAPFSFTSTVAFPGPGAYRFCAYLEIGQDGSAAPPAAFSEAVVQVVAAPVPCSVPRLTGLTLTAATAKLRAAGCSLGKVTKPRRAGRKKLVVRSQDKPSGARFEPGAKVGLVMRVKKARR